MTVHKARARATQLLRVSSLGGERERELSTIVAAVTFICCDTARSTGSSDAFCQMHLRIARVICTCHISSFVYVTHNTYAQLTQLTNVYLHSINEPILQLCIILLKLDHSNLYLTKYHSAQIFRTDVWLKLFMARQCHCPRLIVGHRAAPETLIKRCTETQLNL